MRSVRNFVLALSLIAACYAFPASAADITALFPHVAIGGGYTTVFTFVNTGVDVVNGTLTLTDTQGNPLNANLLITSVSSPSFSQSLSETGNAIAGPSTFVAVKSGGTQIVTATALDPTGPLQTGWARVESTGGALAGVATFQFSPSGSLQTIAGVLSSSTTSVATIPVDNNHAQGRDTGFAVANPSATDSLSIRIVKVAADGLPNGTVGSITLPPSGQTASFLYQVDASFSTFKGSAVLIEGNGKPFAVVALVQAQGQTGALFTAIPVVPAKSPAIN
jgi:hypothetical protein